VVVKLRTLDRQELDQRLQAILDQHQHTLLVLPSVGEHVRDWLDDQGGRATALAYRRDPRTVSPPHLPPLTALEHTPADPDPQAWEEPRDGLAYLRRREQVLAEARRDNAAHRQRRPWHDDHRSETQNRPP